MAKGLVSKKTITKNPPKIFKRNKGGNGKYEIYREGDTPSRRNDKTRNNTERPYSIGH